MSTDVPDDLFARAVHQMGAATSEHIEAARSAQAESARQGVLLPLAEVMVQRGLLTPAMRESVERKLQARQQGGIQQLGPYKLLRKLGEGGMGAVYLAEDTAMQRKVALKILPKKHAGDAEFLTRFKREAQAVGKLNHVNIVAAYDAGEDLGHHYYAMEYCEGESLDARLKREKNIPCETALEIVAQVARGLQHAHENGIIHRDIKPANIFVTAQGVAKILDMGLSKNLAEAEQSFNTQSGIALGTPHYISPEQARADKTIDGRTDIYSLGATLYHIVAGITPFDGSTAAMIMLKHLNEQLSNPQDLNPKIPDGVVQVIMKMMAKAAADRYADCSALLADLERVIDGQAPNCQALEAGKSSVAPRLAVGRTGRQQPVATKRRTTGPVEAVRTGRREATPARSGSRGISPYVLPCVAALALLIGVFAFAGRSRKPEAAPPDVKTAVATPETPKTADEKKAPADLTLGLFDPQRKDETQKESTPQPTVTPDAVAADVIPKPVPGRAGIPDGATEFQNHWYKVIPEKRTWEEARRRCEELGGHLVTISSKEEDSFVNKLRHDTVWIGLSDEREEGTWVWVTGEPLVYTGWNNPTEGKRGRKENHAAMWNGSRWVDWNGSNTAAFVCEWELGEAAKPEVAASTPAPPDSAPPQGKVADVGPRIAPLLAATLQEIAPLLARNKFEEATALLERKLKDPASAAISALLKQEKADIEAVAELRRSAIEALRKQLGKTVTLKKGKGTVTGKVAADANGSGVALDVGGPLVVLSPEQIHLDDIETHAPRLENLAEDARRRALLFLYSGDPAKAKTQFAVAKEFGLGDAATAYIDRIAAVDLDAADAAASKAWESAEALFVAKNMKAAKNAYDAFERDHGATAVAARQRPVLAERRAALDGALGPPKDLVVDLGGGVRMEMVLVRAGEFMMGSEDGDNDEKPVHKVKLSQPFYIGKYEVTLAQFKRFVEATNYVTDCEREQNTGFGIKDGTLRSDVSGINWKGPGYKQEDNHPVVLVSWNDTQAFAAWAAKQSGRDIRVPTEAQWEYAARGPESRLFPWGEEWDPKKANHADNALRNAGIRNLRVADSDDGTAHTAPIGTYQNASWCGAFDLAGNVCEWVQDKHNEQYYAASPAVDPRGSENGLDCVVRGSGWGTDPRSLRITKRFRKSVNYRSANIGFRVIVGGPPQRGG